MNTESIHSQTISYHGQARAIPALPSRMRVIAQLLRAMRAGAVRLEYPHGGHDLFGDGSIPATIKLHDWSLCDAVMKSGDIGLAETYMEGKWDCDNLPLLLEILNRNRAALNSAVYGSWWGRLLYRLRHLFNRNTKAGSRRNIHAHYDLGNDFYRLWLDASMTYSSGLFDGALTCTLEQAQLAKYRRVLNQLKLLPGASVLEIGCGWGGFAELAAREGGLHVTGLTLSKEQLGFARQRIQQEGLANKVSLHLKDYREADGQYDAIASIEMFEAVGEAYWDSYFDCLVRNLKPGGHACIQTIVISDALFSRYRKGTDFIQQYIFPGGMLPSAAVFRELARKHGLEVTDELAFGLDYARTLAEWRRRFREQQVNVISLGFDQRFLRIWNFYLAYCEAGFRAGSIDILHFTLQKK
jgi:cyclopropane-fatty-acyl-phospholipid synthase